MKLIILGSGTSVPHARRASPACCVEWDGGTLLLDMGDSAAHRMAEERLDWAALDAVWVSHFHLDHVGGLAPFLFGTKYAPQTHSRRHPFTIYGPAGTKQLLREFDAANEYGLFKQPFPVEVCEIAPRAKFEIAPRAGLEFTGGLRAETFPTPHTRESLALRLTDARGASLVYTSDTGYTEALAEFARGVGLLLMECSFRHTKPIETHLVLEEAMRLARLAAPRRVVLTHLYPEWDGVEVAAEARRWWDGETIEARDGLRLDITIDG